MALKLEIELVPSTAWYSNVRTNVPRSTWDVIRKKCYRLANWRCQICDTDKARLECHEIWSYTHHGVEVRVQKLEGFIALCPTCHQVKHIGRVQTVEPQQFVRVMSHFIKVNQITSDEGLLELGKAYELWRQRSQAAWELDISYIKDYLQDTHVPVSNSPHPSPVIG